MPEISRFLGIVIAMYYRDHPPPRALSLVVEWAALHRQELLDNWERLRRKEALHGIEGLH
jgi:hypothetical protein